MIELLWLHGPRQSRPLNLSLPDRTRRVRRDAYDNNAVERMLKIVALGRKNWQFAGSERGGRTAAVLFTLVSSAKRHRLNTWAYLRDVLWRLADLKPGELEQLLPDRWQDSRASGR
jgi:transposase